ncbi:alpha/beta hydrolase [uncultured Clostridium sp.]|jgi:pimeloyl-ACP methyl ester carboxylesterase|uniref:alpha/beta fold hydrolase n=1 Tax=uncultured Clostridium sp. TaxID=59620 RepID=UPI0026137BEF|nr:alpha/beta hydrolase [uncultured Clostridium sp.]
MSYLKFNDKNIYYEVKGEGEPLIILNGIMMSHMSWVMFLPTLIKNNKVILLDFIDQGKSDRMEELYSQEFQVDIVKAVIDELKIDKVNILGVSYGGEIAIQFALKYKENINKLLLFNTTAYTNPWLTDIGQGWINVAKTKDPQAFYNVSIPIIYSPEFYSKNIEWMNSRKDFLYKIFNDDFFKAIIRLTESAQGYDVRDTIKNTTANTLVVSGELDFITPMAEQRFISSEIKNSKYIRIEHCGHASMYEKPNEFISIVKGFLSLEEEIKIV